MRYSRHPESDVEERLMRLFAASIDISRKYPLYYTSVCRTTAGLSLTVITDYGHASMFCFPNGIERFDLALDISSTGFEAELNEILIKNFKDYDEQRNQRIRS